MTRIAGTTQPGYSGDGGPATEARLTLNLPVTTSIPVTGPQTPHVGLVTDSAGNIYVSDFGNNRIRRISANGIITTVAGNGFAAFSGDSGPADRAALYFPEGLALDAAGNLLIVDHNNNRVRKVSPAGIITTIAGGGSLLTSADGGPAIKAELSNPNDLVLDAAGNLFISEAKGIRKVSPDGIISTVASINSPSLALDGTGNLYCSSPDGHVYKVAPDGGSTILAGFGNGRPELTPFLALSRQPDGHLLIADFGVNKLFRLEDGGTLTVIAGTGEPCCLAPDGVGPRNAQLDAGDIALDGNGNLFIAESFAGKVIRLSADGKISTVAGTASNPIQQPSDIATDSAGDLYIADGSIRKLTPAGSMSVIQTPGVHPVHIAVDRTGNVFFADLQTPAIWKISPDGKLSTFAGTGQSGFSGDGGQASSAQFSMIGCLVFDADGNLFVFDNGNYRIRKISPGGIVTTIAGNGQEGEGGDGKLATAAQLLPNAALAVDRAGNIFVSGNQRIRRIDPSGVITAIAGNGQFGSAGDGGIASDAEIWNPAGLAVNSAGDVLISENGSGLIRKLQTAVSPVVIGAVLDAASETAIPLTPGKIAVIYGSNLGPSTLAINRPANGAFGTSLAGTRVTFNGIEAPLIYVSAKQLSAIVPYAVSGSATGVVVTSAGGTSSPYTAPLSLSAPAFFTWNVSGAGEIASVNGDGSLNDALHPVPAGGYISLWATGEGQTSPAGIDGKLADSTPDPAPLLPVTLTIDGIPATVVYAGASPSLVAGLMQIVVQIPDGVRPGGYVPVKLSVGNTGTVDGAVWIAVSKP